MKVYEIWCVGDFWEYPSKCYLNKNDAIDYAVDKQRIFDIDDHYSKRKQSLTWQVREILISETLESNQRKFQKNAHHYYTGEFTHLGRMSLDEIKWLMNEKDKNLNGFEKSVKRLCLDLKRAGFDPLYAIDESDINIISADDLIKQRQEEDKQEEEAEEME